MFKTQDSPSEKQWVSPPKCTLDLELWERMIGITFSLALPLHTELQVPSYQSCHFDIFTYFVFSITNSWTFSSLSDAMSELHGGDSKILCLVTLKARMVQRHNSIAVCVVCQASVFPFKTFQVSILTHIGTTTCLVSLLYCFLTSCFTVFQQCFRVGKYSAMQFIGAELNN